MTQPIQTDVYKIGALIPMSTEVMLMLDIEPRPGPGRLEWKHAVLTRSPRRRGPVGILHSTALAHRCEDSW